MHNTSRSETHALPYENYPSWVVSRIISNSIKRENGCLEYGGGLLKHKYGLISITLSGRRMSVTAHRALWMASHRDFDLPSDVYVRHKCDNPCCVNIDHLVAGTPKQNSQDCVERGRRARTVRPHLRHRFVTEETVLAVRAADGRVKDIAAQFGLSPGYVSKLRARKAKKLIA